MPGRDLTAGYRNTPGPQFSHFLNEAQSLSVIAGISDNMGKHTQDNSPHSKTLNKCYEAFPPLFLKETSERPKLESLKVHTI